MMERWLAVDGYLGFYEVGDLGSVRSLDRIVPSGRHPGFTRSLQGCVLRPSPDRHGYPHVILCRDGMSHSVKVHVLVLRTFLGPPPEGMEARHLDDDPTNPVLRNLVWGTRSENIMDQVHRGTHAIAAKEYCPLTHALAVPNLDPAHARAGRRACRACVRTHKGAYRARLAGRPFDFEPEAHRQYAKIMKEAA
jgi:hypothetical protein